MSRGAVKEIRLDIQSELAMNMINYLMIEENYVYVGNEHDIWLENLSHPTVQLIYLNQRSIFNEEQANRLFKQIATVRSRLRRRYLMSRLNVVIFNLDSSSVRFLHSKRSYLKIVHANQASDIQQDEELKAIYPKLAQFNLEQPLSEVMMNMHHATKEKALNTKEMLNFKKKPWVTYGFLLLLVAYFIFLQFQPIKDWGVVIGILYGAKYNPLISAKQYWRLLTPALLHFDLLHLLFNVIFIYQFGRMIENVFGGWRTILLMLGSALFGNLWSYAFVEGVSIGASTIAYGMLGALLFLGIENRKVFMPFVRKVVFPILLFSVFWVVLEPNIDFYGHLGGFLGGFLVATIVGIPHYKYYFSRSILAVATIIVLMSGLMHRGASFTENNDYAVYNRGVIAYYLESNQPEKAYQFMDSLDIDIYDLLTIE